MLTAWPGIPSLLAALVVVACSSPPANPPTKVDDLDRELETETKPKKKAPEAPANDPCAPATLGLSAARPVAPWAAPQGCTAVGDRPGRSRISSEGAFAKRFRCAEGTTSGIDFRAQELVVEDRSLSPAGAGTTIVDDGATVTFIERFRSPCPDDPQPMPMPFTLGFLLPKDATRIFASTTCTLPPKCD